MLNGIIYSGRCEDVVHFRVVGGIGTGPTSSCCFSNTPSTITTTTTLVGNGMNAFATKVGTSLSELQLPLLYTLG